MAIAIIAVVNTWRLYSLPTTFTIELLVVTGTIFVGGTWSLSIAIRGKMPSRRSRLASLVLVALLLAEMLLVLILIFNLYDSRLPRVHILSLWSYTQYMLSVDN